MAYEIHPKFIHDPVLVTELDGKLLNLGTDGAFEHKEKPSKRFPKGRVIKYHKPTQAELEMLHERGYTRVIIETENKPQAVAKK